MFGHQPAHPNAFQKAQRQKKIQKKRKRKRLMKQKYTSQVCKLSHEWNSSINDELGDDGWSP